MSLGVVESTSCLSTVVCWSVRMIVGVEVGVEMEVNLSPSVVIIFGEVSRVDFVELSE